MGPLVRRRVARGACAAIASALIAAGLARADAMDDWAKAIDGVVAELSRPGAQDEFDKIFGDRLKKAGRLLFVDHEYSVTKGSFGSSGWTIPELPYVMGDTPPVGPQLYARWATKGKTGSFLSNLFGTTSPEAKRLREMIKSAAALPPG